MPRKGEKTSEEVRKKISQAKKGWKMSDEHRIKFREGTRKYVEEFIRAHGYFPTKGIHPKTEFKKGNTLWVGRHHTEESKRKLSLALRGLRQSDETRAKKSKAHMGKIPWNKGLTKSTSESVATIGRKKKAWWTDERKRERSNLNKVFFREWWRNHPEAKETITQVSRPTSIELMARTRYREGGFR